MVEGRCKGEQGLGGGAYLEEMKEYAGEGKEYAEEGKGLRIAGSILCWFTLYLAEFMFEYKSVHCAFTS